MSTLTEDQAIIEAPQRRILQGQLAKLSELDRKLDSPNQAGPNGKRPQSLCVTWGPIGQQTPRRSGTAGFEGLAPLVSPGTYLTPNYPSLVNPFVATPGPFYWCSSGVYADVCWTYTYTPRVINTDVTAMALTDNPLTAGATTVNVVSVPAAAPASGVLLIGSEQISYSAKGVGTFTGCVRGVNGTTAAAHTVNSVVRVLSTLSAPVAGVAQGGLFDAAIAQNGGGIILNNFAGTQQFSGFGGIATLAAQVHPRICAEIDIYDKTRNQSLTSGRVPIEVFTGGAYGFKKLPKPLRFERGSQIEPRLYVTECRMNNKMDETAVYTAADVRVYVSMVFKGFNVQPRNQAGFPSYASVGGP